MVHRIGLPVAVVLERFAALREPLQVEVVDRVEQHAVPATEPRREVAATPALRGVGAVDEHFATLGIEHLDEMRSFESIDRHDLRREHAGQQRAALLARQRAHVVHHLIRGLRELRDAWLDARDRLGQRPARTEQRTTRHDEPLQRLDVGVVEFAPAVGDEDRLGMHVGRKHAAGLGRAVRDLELGQQLLDVVAAIEVDADGLQHHYIES